jgi:hypothetical protein
MRDYLRPNPSKKLDMGKGCVRFKKLEDLALDVVGRHRLLAKSFGVARVPVEEHIANYRAAKVFLGKRKSSAKKAPASRS